MFMTESAEMFGLYLNYEIQLHLDWFTLSKLESQQQATQAFSTLKYLVAAIAFCHYM